MTHPKMFGNLFLSVGAMKAGTTWLYAMLERNPALHFTPEKEIHYFYHKYVNGNHLSEQNRLRNARDRYLMNFDPNTANIDRIRLNLHWVNAYLDRVVDDHWYRNLFQMRDKEVFACDFSNLNTHLPSEAWPQIEASCDSLRVLYTLRDPIKRLWSHTKFHLEITGQSQALDTWKPEQFFNFVKKPFMWPNAEYGQALQRLETGISKENLMVLFYEELHADQRGKLSEIENFLGIKNVHYPDAHLERRFTESANRPMPEFFPTLFEKDIARIKSEITNLGYQIPKSWI